MDQILQSNNSSVIMRSLQDSKVADLSYVSKLPYPILAKEYRAINSNSPISGAPMGQEVSFNLIKSKLWADAMIRTSYTFATTFTINTSDDDFHGFNMFEWVQIRSNNKVLFTISDHYIKARVQQERESRSGQLYRMALPLDATTELPTTLIAATPFVTYTPIFSSFFEDVKNHIDLNFYEQLQVVAKFNAQARSGFEKGMASATCTLWNWKYQLDDRAYDVLRAKNQSPERPLNMYSYNTFTEFIQCTNITDNSIRLNVNFPVINTYIMVQNNTATVNVGGNLFKINSFDFSVGGVKLLEAVPDLVGKYEASKKGASSIAINTATGMFRNDSQCVCINWGMDIDRTYFSGGVSFNQINYPQVTVHHSTLTTAANYDLIVVHEYAQILTLDSQSGSISISSSS